MSDPDAMSHKNRLTGRTKEEQERTPGFELGVPELSLHRVELRHSAIVEASSLVRSTLSRLWSASTVEEALSGAAEGASSHFGDAALVGFVHRIAQGRWNTPFLVDRGVGARNARYYDDLVSSLTPARVDEVALYPVLPEPGDVGTLDSYGATSVAEILEAERAKHKIHCLVLLHARIRSRNGVIGGITIKHEKDHEYSEVDRAIISAIASFASLALS